METVLALIKKPLPHKEQRLRTVVRVLCEVALQQAAEATAVASFIARHLVNRVMDGIIAALFGELGEPEFAFASAMLGSAAEFEVALGAVSEDFTKKLGKLRSVFSFLKGIALVRFGNLRVAFPIRDAAHGKVHTDLATLTVKVRPQVIENIFLNALGNTDHMLRSIGGSYALRLKLGRRSLTLRTRSRRLIALMYITTD
jgi:hypothetical protein